MAIRGRRFGLGSTGLKGHRAKNAWGYTQKANSRRHGHGLDGLPAMAMLLSLCLVLMATIARADHKPNIIYILADDLGVGDVGAYGQKILKTPRIDQLAAEGIRFTQHYSGSSLCAPTRSCLLTGQHTGHTRIRANDDGALLDEDVTIGKVLKKAGYKTGVIGKWGVGEEGTTGIPNRQGFDFWFGYLNQSNAHHHYPPFLWRNGQKKFYENNPVARTYYSHDLFTDEALRFIRENRDGPFFLYLAYTLVHVDLDVPEDSMKPWIGKIKERKPYGKPDGQHYTYQERPHAAFAGMVSRLDRDIGRLVDLVDELGIGKDTLVVFTSDNGPTPAGGADPEFFDGNGDLRGIKFCLYEGGIRCPMIARWPGTAPSGSTTDHISAQWDVLPTLAELAGVQAPDGIDGISFAPIIRGATDEQKDHEYLYWETSLYWKGADPQGWAAMRKGKWKAHLLNTRGPMKRRFQLYDLSKDVSESTNVARQYPEVARELEELMSRARTVPAGKPDLLFKPYVPKPPSN